MFDPTKIPEADMAIAVLRGWLRNLFYSFDGNARDQSGTFLLYMVEMVQLAFIFDKDAAQDYLQRMKCVTSPPKWLLRNVQDNSSYVINDLIESLKGSSEHAISTGVLFLM